MFLGWMCSQDECSWGGCVHRMSVLGVDVLVQLDGPVTHTNQL